MRIKKNYTMMPLYPDYFAFQVGEVEGEFVEFIHLNSAGAFLWQSILDGMDSREELLQAMLAQYEDLEESVAERDLDLFLETVANALED